MAMDEMGRADTHVHTEYSGFSNLGLLKFPESVTMPDKIVDCARAKGMDVLCITDHDQTVGGFIAQKYAKKFDDIEVIVGEEVMTKDGEIIGLFLNERIEPMMSVEETVDIIREQGGLTIAPHPFSFHVCGLQEKIFELDLDGIEVINGGHPDKYSNMFAQTVFDRFPGKWAATSGSDAHSKFTMGFNWTEFPGKTAEEFRKAILNKTTVATGTTAPVYNQTQWSVEVVMGGQKLMYKALRGKLEPMEDNSLIDKINNITDLKKAGGLVGGALYLFPPLIITATVLSTSFLKSRAKKMLAQMDERLKHIDSLTSGTV